ncbi:efflux RND transporter periplasmic adaptor subunit [Algicella marina]|uniref:HlyD family efflux transporter periplasmic adaptor subunit n=1 Tax=Algicella marina TaxID=2683284 RepID=A0A6P1T572_9RHOB|nr:HlyD family efflux transporter periplasmic adaptor subunit [Algicella marina]QHQ37177.1 HlyD family efflux transporter periplasmic adaptor subunit [Algicella marina]
MRFLTRGLLGIMLLTLTVGLLGMAGRTVYLAASAEQGGFGGRGENEERIFAVNVGTLTSETVRPIISSYGVIESWRTLELRTAVGGTVTEMADAFRDGGRVQAGDILVQVDRANAETALSLAKTERAEAKAEVTEADAALELAQDELATSEAQRDLRRRALARQEDLRSRGAGTEAAVETAELALSSAEQTLVGRRQALAQAQARINRAAIALERTAIQLSEAERDLSDTVILAPFTGLLSDVTAVPGGLLTTNEQIATLIDPEALEVAFRISNAQFARLVATGQPLEGTEVTATLLLEDIPLVVAGVVDRVDAEVGEGQTGRLLFARLDPEGSRALRPGDFTEVRILEPELAAVSVIPATAANTDGEILLIGEGDRLEMATVRILRRQGNDLIVGDVPFGREYVAERVPQLGAGVKVRPVRPDDGFEESAVIELTPERRALLVAAVEGNSQMPEEVRQRLIARLSEDRVPADMVARIESRMAEADVAAMDGGETLTLEPERRERLAAFVRSSAGMPEDVKARLLSQLEAEEVPRGMVERLESRMGG